MNVTHFPTGKENCPYDELRKNLFDSESPNMFMYLIVDNTGFGTGTVTTEDIVVTINIGLSYTPSAYYFQLSMTFIAINIILLVLLGVAGR
jgi:hypothetical protein